MKRGGSRARLGPRAIEELLKSSNPLAPGCKRGRNRAVLLHPERASAASIEFLARPGELIGERKSELQPMPDNAPRSAPGLDRPSSIAPRTAPVGKSDINAAGGTAVPFKRFLIPYSCGGRSVAGSPLLEGNDARIRRTYICNGGAST